MESIIGFIFDNLFFVLIVLFGLMNLLGRSKNEEQEGKKSQPQRRPAPVESRNQQETRMERRRNLESQRSKTAETLSSSPLEQKSIDVQRQEQFERLKQQYQSSYTLNEQETFTDMNANLGQPIVTAESTDRTEKIDIDMNRGLENRLTRKGLIESVIMAEVLGPPRSRQRMSYRPGQRR